MPATTVRINPLDCPTNTVSSVSISTDRIEDGPRSKKLRYEDDVPSDSQNECNSSDTAKRRYLDDIVKTQIDLSQISARLTARYGSGSGIKRKAGEIDDDEQSGSDGGSDMDMDIDD